MLLKVGVAMMVAALAFAAVTVGIIVGIRDQPEPAIAAKPAATSSSSVEPLVRSYPSVKPQIERAQARPEPEPQPKQVPEPEPRPEPEPQPKPRPEPAREPERNALSVAEDDWPMPTQEQLEAANEPRHYDLLPGAMMGLTIKSLGVYNAPVYNSESQWALNNGIAHVPETSLPWSPTPQRNVYLEGHRLGWPGTGSYLVFYYLNELDSGDEVVLKDRDGEAYRYRVSEVFVVDPTDVWVMGQVRGRDMVTLQTCTPIPIFDKRLIVRADRV
jgi:sortase A